jgi:hypothetical protein
MASGNGMSRLEPEFVRFAEPPLRQCDLALDAESKPFPWAPTMPHT